MRAASYSGEKKGFCRMPAGTKMPLAVSLRSHKNKKIKKAKQRRRGGKTRGKTRRVFRERSYSERRRASAEDRGKKRNTCGHRDAGHAGYSV